ncbi:MAG: M20/M25/M40 family metallo-hydrolase [Rhodospirillaceae bacterium]|nr:M20/M25/M40 family metallo-hydrolase [Rhodospirillaceae bacterium]
MKTTACSAAALIAGLAFGPSAAFAADAAADAARVLASPAFKTAATSIENEYQRIVDEGIKLTEIPAPPFKEEKRGKEFAAMVKAAGLSDVKIDPEGNVIALRKGTHGDGKFVVVSAHLDTVFPEGTNVKVKREGTKLMAPGIGDDTFSLATLLAQIRAIQAANIKTRDDILFVGTVGEEGQGDLRGVRYLFTKGEYKGKIKAFFSIEAGDVSAITNGGVGSRRYRVTFKGPGGHSYGAFGLVNPMYALSNAATEFSRLQVPSSPKTTYGIGVIGGGTSVNSIPLEAWMEIDMRSESVAELKRVEERMMSIMQSAADSENFNRSTKEGRITVESKLIGDRPAGNTDAKAELVQQAAAAIAANGYKVDYQWSSTDSNIPMNLGIPAITIGRGGPGKGGRAHSLDEWVDVEKGPMVKAAVTGLSIILTATGME